jgi:hypothetical protein
MLGRRKWIRRCGATSWGEILPGGFLFSGGTPVSGWCRNFKPLCSNLEVQTVSGLVTLNSTHI